MKIKYQLAVIAMFLAVALALILSNLVAKDYLEETRANATATYGAEIFHLQLTAIAADKE